MDDIVLPSLGDLQKRHETEWSIRTKRNKEDDLKAKYWSIKDLFYSILIQTRGSGFF